ncbi:MAG: hypothetical protein ACRCSU_00120 [Paracoccaceae bacterium]
MILGLGLSASAPLVRSGAAEPPAGFITATNFSRDRVLFDSRAALGETDAVIPISGTGSMGMTIEARGLSLDDGGATSTAWTDISITGPGETWAGNLTLPRSPSWFAVQVRLKELPQISASIPNRVGVGHVIAIWGQSEHARFWSAFHSQTIPASLLHEDRVQMMWFDAGVQHQHLTNATALTAGAVALANVLMAERPGEKFALVHHTQPGTDPRSLVNDADPQRSWANDLALHQFATADGQSVGLAAWSWFAAPGSLGSAYGEALFPLFSGKTLAGTTVSFPTDIGYGSSGGSYHADHWFGELYDYSETRWVPFGPHKFEIGENMVSAVQRAVGGVDTNLVNKQSARAAWRAMLANPQATMFLSAGIEPMNYQNGVADGASWTDIAHPTAASDDGIPAFARLTAHAILQSAGLSTRAAPHFDNCQWAANGAHVEVWSSAGPITTTRLARAEAPLGTTRPHWTQVFGFQINGAPALNTQIVSGRVRVMPNAAAFVPGDVLTFGEGGGSGALAFPDDHVAQTWKNYPIVDVGATGVTGLPVSPMPSATVLQNTLVGTPVFTVGAGGPYFLDPAVFGPNSGRLQFAMRAQLVSPASACTLGSLSGNMFKLEAMAAGTLRLNIRDSAAAVVVSNVTGGFIPYGAFCDIVAAVDLVALYARVWLNGALVINATVGANTGQFAPTTRVLSALALNTGTAQAAGTIEYVRFWKDASPTGGSPAAPSYKSISGPAAIANADPWKRPPEVNAT